MKISLRFFVPVGAAIFFLLPFKVLGQAAATSSPKEFTPKYDLAGHWLTDEVPTPPPSTITRNGKHITGTYNNALYEHTFEGDYINPTTIEGTCKRRKRSDNTTTITHLTWVFSSPNTVRNYWIALDSNSDLTMGQNGYSDNWRVPDSQPPGAPASGKTPPLASPPELAPKPVDPMSNID